MFTIVGYVVRSPIFFFLIGDLMEIGLRSAAFLPLISLKKGLKFASQTHTNSRGHKLRQSTKVTLSLHSTFLQ